jgi:TusA-related sulfurtransferase
VSCSVLECDRLSIILTKVVQVYPSFETVKAMHSLKTGDVLEIITDSDESALKSIPTVCDNRKWEFLVLEEEKDTWRIRIRK